MPSEIESAHRIIEAETKNYIEALSLPSGFVTEKGSSYSYLKNGRIKRSKYDGTHHEQGIAVFIPPTPEGDSMRVRVLNNLDKTRPSDTRLTIKIAEKVKDEATGQLFARFRTSTNEVQDPNNLGLLLINKQGLVVEGIDVSIQPSIGSAVLEMDLLPDGSTTIHPGHKVVEIVE